MLIKIEGRENWMLLTADVFRLLIGAHFFLLAVLFPETLCAILIDNGRPQALSLSPFLPIHLFFLLSLRKRGKFFTLFPFLPLARVMTKVCGISNISLFERFVCRLLRKGELHMLKSIQRIIVFKRFLFLP